MTALLPEQFVCIRGAGEEASIQEMTSHYETGIYSRIYQNSFWSHFVEHLSDFTDPFPPQQRSTGLYFLPEGGVLEGSYSGVIVARGDLDLTGSAELSGLLLHLGNGQLRLADQAAVLGGVWLSDLDYSGDQLSCREVSLRVSGSSRIVFDAKIIRSALRSLPATQLGWRMIFPEMNSD
jgi:hypothetical protein